MPGHADEVERCCARRVAATDRVYIRLSEEANDTARPAFQVVRARAPAAPLVVAVGPMLDPVLDASPAPTWGRLRRRGCDRSRRSSWRLAAGDIVLVEPYMAGTSAGEMPFERPRRLHCLGVRDPELRRYGTGADHRRAHGLDAGGIARSLVAVTS